MAGYPITFSHTLPMLIVSELLILMDSLWMSQEVWLSVDDGLSAFELCHFTRNGAPT